MKYSDVLSNVKDKIANHFIIGIVAVTVFLLATNHAEDISPFVQIPFEINSGYLVFPAPIEPSGCLFLLFDTGCQTTNISNDVLERVGKQSITLLLGTRKLKIDNYHVDLRMRLSKTTGQKIDGIIGNDILHRYTVKTDFKNKLLSLYDSEKSVSYTNGFVVGIEVNSFVSSVPLTITFLEGQQVEGNFVIDTGAPINVLINSPAAEKSGLHVIMGNSKKSEFKTQADVQSAVPARAESVRIGEFECDDMEVFISTSKKGLFAVSKYAGIVGNKFFQNFNVIFDYKRKRLHIERY